MADDAQGDSMATREVNLVFVYGTLMRGGKLHKYLAQAGAKFVAGAKIRGELYSLPGRFYPAAVPSGRCDRLISGEMYRLLDPARGLKLLDEVEGCAEGLFCRCLVDAQTASGRKKAWVYFYAKPLGHAQLIPTGKYRGGRA